MWAVADLDHQREHHDRRTASVELYLDSASGSLMALLSRTALVLGLALEYLKEQGSS